MQNEKYDFVVFIGRFQPFHIGHLAVMREGLARAQHLIILCGSSHQPRSTRNPWTYLERESMIRGALSEQENARMHFAPLMDVMYNDEAWVRNVQSTVNGIVTAHHNVPHKDASVALIGHSKDHSSYYLNLFPQWGALNVDNVDGLNATALRDAYFCSELKTFLSSELTQNALPDTVGQTMADFAGTEAYRYLREEYEFIVQYKSAWANAPYAPTFVTVDAVVIQSGHVLMVKRRARPGEGLLALPGGFANPHERLVDACLRELKEETRIKLPLPVLKGSIAAQRVFDDPHRSARGRTITHTFYLELTANNELPKVRGGDDAKRAMWVPLADLNPTEIFEDHYFIIQQMIGF